jgi:hypothetical protein
LREKIPKIPFSPTHLFAPSSFFSNSYLEKAFALKAFCFKRLLPLIFNIYLLDNLPDLPDIPGFSTVGTSLIRYQVCLDSFCFLPFDFSVSCYISFPSLHHIERRVCCVSVSASVSRFSFPVTWAQPSLNRLRLSCQPLSLISCFFLSSLPLSLSYLCTPSISPLHTVVPSSTRFITNILHLLASSPSHG